MYPESQQELLQDHQNYLYHSSIEAAQKNINTQRPDTLCSDKKQMKEKKTDCLHQSQVSI